MGNYNPHAPFILGEEWVPIRNEDAVFSPAVNSVELGHKFTLLTSRAVNNARFYINELRPSSDRGQTFLAAIYPFGTEDQSGPIERCVIPCNAVILTSATVGGAPTAIEALVTQSTSSGISLDCSQPNTGLALSFAVSSYPQLLNKRILGVNLLSGTAASSDITGPTRNVNTSVIKVSTTSTIGSATDPEALFGRLRLEHDIDTTPFGEINQFFIAGVPNTLATRAPWTSDHLGRLDTTAARLYTRIESGTNRGTTANSSCYIFYAALEVIYCEEKRLAYGAKQFGTSNASHSFGAESILGANIVSMYAAQSLTTDPVLPAGDYLLTISSADVGGLNDNQAQTSSDYPDLNAVRELYGIAPHTGMQIDIPFPRADRIGDTLTSKTVHILPQLSLHASGGTLTEPHVYGRQAVAQVYGVNNATQSIYDDISGVNASYPQVRYYARRFGDTTVPLTLAGASALNLPGGANYASTPDNAALDITGDIEIDFYGDINWRPAAASVLVSKWNEPTNNRSYLFFVDPTGLLTLTWSTNGTNVFTAASTVGVPITSGVAFVSAHMDVDNGGGGRNIAFFYGSNSQSANLLGAVVTQVGTTSIFSGSSEVEVGIHSGVTSPLTGLVYSVAIRNGLGGLEVANPNFTTQTPGAASFVDAAGRTWTMVGTAAIVGGNPASNVSVSVSTFDQLPKILDGWREVTLQFGTPPIMGAQAGLPRYIWSAAGETAGNRWEILGASAPAVSGIGTNLFNPVPSPNQLGVATYQPSSGEAVHFEWYPQGVATPFVSTMASDFYSDAVLIFSQDPAAITGLAVNTLSQALTQFTECAHGPCCLPTAIQYNRVTWNTLPTNADGTTELQRFDTLGGWQTIMLATSPSITGFNDYEARVGVQSSYRIRALNALNFVGPWSITGTATISEPGVTLPSCGASKRGVLIFTTNEVQNGSSNLAYAMTWDGSVIEDFSFPEMNQLDIQTYLDRDYQVAFHGTERGGEQFTRQLLLANAAVARPRLANIRSLRDLAWSDLAYVCVRDDIGDRWFATIIVPSSEVRRNRRLYNAQISVVEVTTTSSQVNP